MEEHRPAPAPAEAGVTSSPAPGRGIIPGKCRSCRCRGAEPRGQTPQPPPSRGAAPQARRRTPRSRYPRDAQSSPCPAVGEGQLGRGCAGHPPREPPPQRGSGGACGTQTTFVFTRFLLVFPKQTPINVNITDVNKRDPHIHVQLYVTGEREGGKEEKHFN